MRTKMHELLGRYGANRYRVDFLLNQFIIYTFHPKNLKMFHKRQVNILCFIAGVTKRDSGEEGEKRKETPKVVFSHPHSECSCLHETLRCYSSALRQHSIGWHKPWFCSYIPIVTRFLAIAHCYANVAAKNNRAPPAQRSNSWYCTII